MPQSSRTKQLPTKLLADPRMIDACRARDFAVVFKLAKTYAGIYPSMIARLCDLTPSRVGEVMSGRRQLVHMDVIERVADGLRIPGCMLGLATRPWEMPTTAAASLESRAVASDDVASLLALTVRAHPGQSTLHALQSSIEDYWRRDDEHGGEALRPAVVGQLRYVEGLLKESSPEDVRRGLFGIAAELARLTGWTHFDARQFSESRIYFAEALQFAKVIDDRQFMANVLACMSLQATYQDKLADAVALVKAAQNEARSSVETTPRVLSMLSMREAFAYAAMGSPLAHQAISEAQRQFAQVQAGDSDPAWVTYFDETKLIVDTGIAHGRLGEAAVAEPLIEEALRNETSANRRGRAFHAFWLARTQLDLGNLDQACHTATQALESAMAVVSQRVVGHLREFYAQLAPYRKSREVTSFEERLSEALPVPVSGWPHP
ncbi:hypothetical protein ACFVIM_22205 [Streptomyces sp. NPDC057638]|uniref:hypothetical protein n=1 Tax=Streptomyces sp. NPDC057638 TaxID=3346190 RepID=UPI0036ABA454